VIVYAPRPQPVPAPLSVRLIGVLDPDLVAAFAALERGLAAARGATVVVDVRDVQVFGEAEMDALASAVATARREGRDVRLDARSLHWRRAAKKNISTQPPVDAQLRSGVRRTVILAHSALHKRKRR
jgi:anti-anti-sigma regulatory factor